jgi:hypothetical protein
MRSGSRNRNESGTKKEANGLIIKYQIMNLKKKSIKDCHLER